jgi:multidrug efflux pump subunit AcrA (membrane-fusion protein)
MNIYTTWGIYTQAAYEYTYKVQNTFDIIYPHSVYLTTMFTFSLRAHMLYGIRVARARWRTSLIVVALCSILIFAYTHSTDEIPPAVLNSPPSYTLTRAEGVPLPIEGVLVPSQDADIASKSAGVISARPVAEGSRVSRGDVLAVVGQPTVAAQRATLVAQIESIDAERVLTEVQASGGAHLALIQSITAARAEDAVSEYQSAAVTQYSRATMDAIRALYLAATEAVKYLSDTTSIGNTTVNELRRQVARELGGDTRAAYLGEPIRTSTSGEGFIDRFNRLEQSGALHPEEILSLARTLSTTSDVLGRAYEAAEREAYARGSNASASEVAAYNAYRTNLASAQAALSSAHAQLTTALKAQTSSDVSQSGVAATALSQARTAAITQQQQVNITATTRATLVARLRELDTQLGEAVVRAPYNGIITSVVANVGQYVSPGTPLMHLEASGTTEVEILIPESYVAVVVPGTVVRYEGGATGTVQRTTSRLDAVTGGAYAYATYVSQASSSVPVTGTHVRGELMLVVSGGDAAEQVFFAPHAFVLFDVTGPVVRTLDRVVAVRIVRDTLTGMYITSDELTEGSVLLRSL